MFASGVSEVCRRLFRAGHQSRTLLQCTRCDTILCHLLPPLWELALRLPLFLSSLAVGEGPVRTHCPAPAPEICVSLDANWLRSLLPLKRFGRVPTVHVERLPLSSRLLASVRATGSLTQVH